MFNWKYLIAYVLLPELLIVYIQLRHVGCKIFLWRTERTVDQIPRTVSSFLAYLKLANRKLLNQITIVNFIPSNGERNQQKGRNNFHPINSKTPFSIKRKQRHRFILWSLAICFLNDVSVAIQHGTYQQIAVCKLSCNCQHYRVIGKSEL